ncbi:MAG: sigma 54-interacting transcriptional regulator [Candidatus Cloacimonetes bacterium]|jgi:Nif-specific regulatory protein|nr:sigma 54-interacting transcriptional regulator [Candidatus Cloacimonadota bacterium]MDY0336927.1 sigma 54-interacting transcriptional regulator [Candidatus Cloacimonadaceae bacterium]MCK9334774.1 sigma 54-interacting transcriptional regulator [Candidatus Cloacimonadota bacterium]MDD2543032.1 sigma 54-interacting transcriptional regulator [Candidatus Cloacimonadota bacterium]MDD3097487.1 sigma 54-interacting transcriptional regulator [Candidatus Cloacimonadota bacterium]
MPEKLYQKMHEFVSERFDITRVLDLLKDKKRSHLVEITGKSGSGKSYLIAPIIEALRSSYSSIHYFSPHPLYYNHFTELLQILSGLDEKQQDAFFEEHYGKYHTGRKYDFFYFLTEQLLQKDLLHSLVLVIDDCDVLDQYSRDFLQYLVQYASDCGLQVLAFSQQHLFPFSIVEKLPSLGVEDMQKLLGQVFPSARLSYISEGEILHNISGGNLMILEKIFSGMRESLPKGEFDLSPYLEKTYDPHDIYIQTLEELSKKQIELLIAMYVLDGLDCDSICSALGKKSCKADLQELQEKGLLAVVEDRCVIQKKLAFQTWLHHNEEDDVQALMAKLLAYLKKQKLLTQVQLQLHILGKSYQKDIFDAMLNLFKSISDASSRLKIYEYLLSISNNPPEQLQYTAQIASCNSDLSQKDKAVDFYRQCLHICTENNLPAEEIVYHLSNNLFAVNSSSFALEIIKKYSPATIDAYWKARILLLKSDIQAESEDFNAAFETLDTTLHAMSAVEDQQKRYLVQAEAKKIRGKIHYYINEWDQSEEAFKESETMYGLANDHSGLAAIYNNLGVLYMFQGDWERSESYFLKSLALEKEYFNLNGISVCFNNLGGLMDDKGDPSRSLYYLEEALKIQKLLSEPYNITNIYNNIGVTMMDHGEYARAEDALQKSLETAIEFGFFRNTIASLNNLGALAFKKGDWKGSIQYYEKAIKRSEENAFSEGLLRSYNNLGEVYEKSGELNLAYDLYFKGLELLPTVSDEYIKAELHGNLGSVLTKLHKFKEAYRYLMESFDFFKALGARDKIIEGCQNQAYYFILTRNAESADYYINEALKLATEQQNDFGIGWAHYLRALLERKNTENAKSHLDEAIKLFVASGNHYELSLANYELAGVLLDMKEWEQALQILKNNKKIIQQYGSIKLLEQNDILMQRISREFSSQLQEVKFEENLLNQFYEITQKLNTITDLDLIIEQSLSSLIEISEADGGILCLHNNGPLPDAWEYKLFKNFSVEDNDYDAIMNLCVKVLASNQLENFKQPHFAPLFNNILLMPLSIRKNTLGVVVLFCKSGSHYFSERIINLLNALSNQIIVIIENIRSANLEKTHATIREQLHEGNLYANIIGKSPEMVKIFEIIEKVKDTPTTVLLEGGSGTGKELIARALHYSSNRSNKAFVAQYCGALPETLLESELFGHVKGSFTGAAYDKKGLFEIADGGTFFLDEISDISQSTQAKLLRFLQEGEVKRVGATKTEKVNVRVVCATNVPLLEKVNKGDFRLDLYYRLNVIRIQVPPLRNRPGDVPLLAIHFLDKYNKRMGKNVLGFSADAMKTLENYEFPGNVRQLENEIERAVTLVEDSTFITPADFSEEVHRHMEHSRTIDLLSSKKNLKEAVEELERKMITSCMERYAWNQTQAARELGLSRQGLIKKLQRYNLYREEE